jgi:hypothetical protein
VGLKSRLVDRSLNDGENKDVLKKSKDGGETDASSWLQVCMKRHTNSHSTNPLLLAK